MTVDTPAGFGGHPIQAIRLGTAQNVSCAASGGSATVSNPFGAQTELIMVTSVTNDTRVAIGASGSTTAGATSTLVPKGATQYFRVFPAWVISIISNDTNTGSMSVTEAVSQG